MNYSINDIMLDSPHREIVLWRRMGGSNPGYGLDVDGVTATFAGRGVTALRQRAADLATSRGLTLAKPTPAPVAITNPAGAAATRASLLAEGGATLDSAYELDDAPGFERFLMLSSAADFDLLAVEAALRAFAASGPGAATEAPRLPAGIEWKSFLLRKPGAAR